MVHLILNAKSLINVKKTLEMYFRASRREFLCFPNTALDHGGASQYLLEFLWILFQYLAQALCKV